MSGEIDEKRLAEIEARSGECSCGFNTCSAGADVPDLIADLRAARAEIERLCIENQKLKAENLKAQAAVEFGVDDEVWRPGETAVDALIRKVAALEALEQSLRNEIARLKVGGAS